ncbi:hypothetical protein AYK21_02395 [Thermoplasmatales archaeon SG8-52-2]|nr:MAG: hypothetical protein AYK21_02395 [Thermoplasmatales archaeon SG8-52-2]
MNKIFALCLIILIFAPSITFAEDVKEKNFVFNDFTISSSIRKQIEDVIIIPDTNPFYGLIGSYIACWYNVDNDTAGLVPLLVQNNQKLTFAQEMFLDKYLETNDKKLLVIGEQIESIYDTIDILGSPISVAIDAALHAYSEASSVLILPYIGEDAYELGLIASPIASYLNIPILFYDNNQMELENVCNKLNVKSVYVVGDIQLSFPNITTYTMETKEEIRLGNILLIQARFNSLNYITLTNPSDTIPPYVIETENTSFIDNIKNFKLTFLGKEINFIGTGIKQYNISVPDGINKVNIYGKLKGKKNIVSPIIYMYLYDPDGNIVSYSNSLSYEIGETYIETLTCNASGNYTLVVSFYHGFKGGFFLQRGFSYINSDFEILINISTLEKPHMPLVPNLSIIAPYLTCAHGGMIVADPGFEITGDDYTAEANGSGTGPWYNEKLHFHNNEKVNYTIEQLENSFLWLEVLDMLDSYLNGSAWLAILGDTNMIPMYYYSPSQPGIPEKGLPSDNPYSLDWNLSVGRIMGWNIQDVSLLISRTLFYKEICDEPEKKRDWHNRFSFIFGEGFGETGGIFHQIPYAFEIRKYGFKPRVFGDFRNGRQLAVLFKTYSGSNYIELISHADWFWFAPSMYGIDTYSRALDVSHVKNWIFDKPSIFMASACLMGRIDGIPPEMSIGLTLLHAGCNCFIGATRETGSEAGLTTFENHLIVDNYSVGEALRGEKRIDKELPNYYVRTLYGDPAFNPYEPNNGFSNQGRPILS